MTRTDSTADPDADREALALAPGFPPRAALLVEASLAACAARGVPRPRARLWLEGGPTSALGSALGPRPQGGGAAPRARRGGGDRGPPPPGGRAPARGPGPPPP